MSTERHEEMKLVSMGTIVTDEDGRKWRKVWDLVSTDADVEKLHTNEEVKDIVEPVEPNCPNGPR